MLLKLFIVKNCKLVGVQEDDDHGLLLDPADCLKLLTGLQKGPYQPQLKHYPENPNITQKKQHMFSSTRKKESVRCLGSRSSFMR